ncbi:MAG: hypothetical protein V4582_06590 [Pseudomonadota bacterium]
MRPLTPAMLVLYIAIGCALPAALAAPIIPPHTFSLRLDALSLPVGSSAFLQANNGGGEAIRFFTDWRVQEGAAGGTLGQPVQEGIVSTVNYTAPSQAGIYHVIASDRTDPAHFSATITITVTP